LCVTWMNMRPSWRWRLRSSTRIRAAEPVEVAERLVEEKRLRLRHEHTERATRCCRARERRRRRDATPSDPPCRAPRRRARGAPPSASRASSGRTRRSRGLSCAGRGRSAETPSSSAAGQASARAGSARRAGSPPRRHLVPADHAQRRRLAAARRPEEHDVLAVLDRQVDVVDGDRSRPGRPSSGCAARGRSPGWRRGGRRRPLLLSSRCRALVRPYAARNSFHLEIMYSSSCGCEFHVL
jgi:hypothetical protein